MGRDGTYLFGRFHLQYNYAQNNKKSYIRKSISGTTSVSVQNFEWSIFDDIDFMYENQYFIYGCLAKYKIKAEEPIVDRNRHVFSKTSIPDKVIAKSPFLLHPDTGVIAYHPVTGKISSNQFQRHFCHLIRAANDYLLVEATIETIDDETEILQALETFEVINYISIQLHPSNPSNREIWRRTDERLHQLNIEKYQEIYESKKGIILPKNDPTYGNILMAADGYGKAQISGLRNSEKHEVSTEKMPIKGEAPVEDEPEGILKGLISKFRSIWERMKQ